MTTTVTIEAHCDPETTEVKIIVTGLSDVIIQDGESYIANIYGDVTVNVAEIEKTQSATTTGGPGGCEKCPPN